MKDPEIHLPPPGMLWNPGTRAFVLGACKTKFNPFTLSSCVTLR